MKCPVCVDSTLVMADRTGIEVDYCPTCRGVWLDRGELDKIVERSAGTGPAAVTRRDDDRRRRDDDDDDWRGDHRYGKKKRRSSIFEEIFDF